MKKALICLAAMWVPLTWANMVQIKMYETAQSGLGKYIGTITAMDAKKGLELKTNLTNLSPGQHGFHIHEVPNCGDMGMNAKGHLDPMKTNKHMGPFSKSGHLGDLPVLNVDQQGNAKETLTAPRLTVAMIDHHALMIHVGGDNYSDSPKPLGGGGARFACGIIP